MSRVKVIQLIKNLIIIAAILACNLTIRKYLDICACVVMMILLWHIKDENRRKSKPVLSCRDKSNELGKTKG